MAATDFVTESQIDSLTTNIATSVKANATAIGTVGNLNTTATDLTNAVNEVKATADGAAGGGVAINDGATNTTQAWSSQRIVDEIDTVLDGAPAALDTLNELAAAIGDDANFAATTTTALGNRVRVDAAQAFNAAQQLQGRENIAVITSVVDFAAAYNAALA